MNPPPGIEELPNGQWVVAGDTHFAEWSRQHGNIITDPSLFKWLKPHLEGVKVVWDLGACIGDHTRWYLDQGYEVVAFEPNPDAFTCLSHNCPESENHKLGASDKDRFLRFTVLDNVGASRVTPEGAIAILAKPLDSLNLPAPDFVKLDCEGWEVHALRGMIETLKEHKPILFIEINRGALAANGHTRDDIVMLLKDIGYRSFTGYPDEVSWDSEQFDLLIRP